MGGPDLFLLDQALRTGSPDLTICTLSAASNITGITSDVAAITDLVKSAGAKMIWDYAGAGPYVPISMPFATTYAVFASRRAYDFIAMQRYFISR